MRRFGRVIRVRPEQRDAYVAMHASPPSELLDDLRARNVRNYSIFLRGDLLFAYFEYTGSDLEADMAGGSDAGNRWAEQIRPLLEPMADGRTGEWWADMDEVFHLD